MIALNINFWKLPGVTLANYVCTNTETEIETQFDLGIIRFQCSHTKLCLAYTAFLEGMSKILGTIYSYWIVLSNCYTMPSNYRLHSTYSLANVSLFKNITILFIIVVD